MNTAPLTLRVFRGDDLLRTESFAREIIKIGRLASAHLCLTTTASRASTR